MSPWLTVFTGILAFAVLLQGIALLATYFQIRNLSGRVDQLSRELSRQALSLMGKVDEATVSAKKALEKAHVLEDNFLSIVKTVQTRVEKLDAFLAESTDVARLEIARAQDVIDTAAQRLDETFDILQKGLLIPATEFGALFRGIKAGIDTLFFRRRRGPSNGSHQDEEMFI